MPRWRSCATGAPGRTGGSPKAAKDFLTEVDLATEAEIRAPWRRPRPISASTARRAAGRPWIRAGLGRRPARRDDQLRDRLPAVRRDARTAGRRRAGPRRHRPAVPRRTGGLAARWPTSTRSRRGSSAWATRSTAAAPDGRLPDLAASVHRRALRFRCVGAASVLWTWLAGGQIQGMVLAHNNPYDVVAGHCDCLGSPTMLSASTFYGISWIIVIIHDKVRRFSYQVVPQYISVWRPHRSFVKSIGELRL